MLERPLGGPTREVPDLLEDAGAEGLGVVSIVNMLTEVSVRSFQGGRSWCLYPAGAKLPESWNTWHQGPEQLTGHQPPVKSHCLPYSFTNLVPASI